MPTYLIVVLLLAPSVLWVPVVWLVRWYRRRRGLTPGSGLPHPYRDLDADDRALHR